MSNHIGLPLDNIGSSWKAYVAGLIDGEGHLGIYKCRIPNSPRPQHQARMLMGLTTPEVLYQMQRLFGGSVFRLNRTKQNPKHRDLFCWNLVAYKLLLFLEAVEPYLIIKQRQAQIMISFLSRKHQHRQGKDLSNADLEERDFHQRLISELNNA